MASACAAAASSLFALRLDRSSLQALRACVERKRHTVAGTIARRRPSRGTPKDNGRRENAVKVVVMHWEQLLDAYERPSCKNFCVNSAVKATRVFLGRARDK